jgi:hypothetical protein
MMSLDLLTEGGRGYRLRFKLANRGTANRSMIGNTRTICSTSCR